MTILLLLCMPASVASAQALGRCYPPPCAVEAGVPADFSGADLSGPAQVVGARALGEEQSAAPLVLAGLVAVMVSLTVVGMRRRTHIVRRGKPALAPTPAPPGPGPAASMPGRAKQAALRSSVL